jgi:hypothetical protein
LNPLLYKAGILARWQPGMDTVSTTFNNSIDFWWSFSIGVTIAIACISFYQTGRDLIRNVRRARAERRGAAAPAQGKAGVWAAPPGRGDFSLWIAVALYAAASLLVVTLCHWLVPRFPLYFLLLFVLVYTPVMAYIDARLVGICGQTTNIPLVKEAAIILSGYKGVDIWMAPIPVDANTGSAGWFRSIELTGTNFFSYVKSSALTLPLGFVLSFIFWAFIWKSGAIPSDIYPYAQKMWELQAKNAVLLYSSTMEMEGAKPLFFQALHPAVIGGAFTFAIAVFAVFTAVKLPVLTIFGFVQSVGGMPHAFVMIVIGALLGQFYFRRRFGSARFLQMAPVLLAGYGTGVGLIALIGVAVNLIVSAVSGTPF